MSLESVCLYAYFAVLVLLSVYGLHRYAMLALYRRHRGGDPEPSSFYAEDALPRVTLQLPVYNERCVVERLLAACAALDYPRERLQIQVLDDSTDETTAIVRDAAARLRSGGADIGVHHRVDRAGFKAGALEAGLASATGELIAILDADFVPPPDFLRRTVHHFSDPAVGLVQTRWGHLNRDASLLTSLQSIFLDGHLVIEQTARNRSGRFFNFNGTAGVWRRTAITESGGWQHDTLTEDMDLSFRAQLAGWRFVYLKDAVTPAELPADINAFRSQQHRWTKGALQVARKLLVPILRSDAPLRCKVEATLQLTMGVCYALMAALVLLMPAVASIRLDGWATLMVDLPLFVAATSSLFAFYGVSQLEAYTDGARRLRHLPLLIALGVGMVWSNARAAVEGLVGHDSPFVRTPKAGDGAAGYASPRTVLPALELACAAYLSVAWWLALSAGRLMALPFLTLFIGGLLYVGAQSLIPRAAEREENVRASTVG